MDPKQKPPKLFVAKGTCPFENCRYGTWKVIKETAVYAHPEDSKIVSTLVTSDLVEVITITTKVEPEPLAIVYDHEKFEKGEVIFLLDYVGEGFYSFWHQGKISNELFVYPYSNTFEFCIKLSQSCWVEKIYPKKKFMHTSWIKMKLPNGKIGWSNQLNHFSFLNIFLFVQKSNWMTSTQTLATPKDLLKASDQHVSAPKFYYPFAQLKLCGVSWLFS